MIVLDANIIAYAFIQGVFSDQARKVWQKDLEWVVPALVYHEYLNILGSYIRFGGASFGDASGLWNEFDKSIRGRVKSVDMIKSLKASAHYKISTYDGQYVALAEELGVPLVSEDKTLRKAVPRTVLSMDAYLADK